MAKEDKGHTLTQMRSFFNENQHDISLFQAEEDKKRSYLAPRINYIIYMYFSISFATRFIYHPNMDEEGVTKLSCRALL